MIRLSDLGQVYIVCGKTGLRKDIDGLAILIKEQFELILLVVKFFFSVVEARIASKPSIGAVKVSGYSIKDLKMEK